MDNRDYEKALDKCWNKFCESQPTLSKQAGVLTFFNFIFDYLYHVETPNLTSDAEGEDEMLFVSRKRVQEEYAILSKELSRRDTDAEDYIAWNYAKMTFEDLFGSKCLPDETPLSQNPPENCDKANHISTDDNKPAEPKFKVGDKVVNHLTGEVNVVAGKTGRYHYSLRGCDYSVHEDYLEPYTEPEESANISQNIANCDKEFDNILKDSLSKERRLSIAVRMTQALISAPLIPGVDPIPPAENLAKTAFRLADALIAECEKGWSHD